MTSLQGIPIDVTEDMRGWTALMLPSSFRLCAPEGELRFWKGAYGWCFVLDDLAALRASLREAAKYVRLHWSLDPASGRVFGPGGQIWSRRGPDYLELISPHFDRGAIATDCLDLSYTDLAAARSRLAQQAHAIRQTQRRKASHDIHTDR